MRYPAHALEPEDCAKLLKACGSGWIGERDRAVVVTLWRTGIRAAELCGLDTQDLQRRTGGLVVRVRRPKGYARGAQPREIGLDPKATAVLEHWLEVRGELGDKNPLFPTRTGGRLATSHVRRLVATLGRRAALGRRVHPHALRHTFAVEFYEETGHDIRLVQLALGHGSLKSTEHYLVSIGATQVVEFTQRRVW